MTGLAARELRQQEGRLVLHSRQAHDEARAEHLVADASAVVRCDLAAQGLDDLATDRQPQS